MYFIRFRKEYRFLGCKVKEIFLKPIKVKMIRKPKKPPESFGWEIVKSKRNIRYTDEN